QRIPTLLLTCIQLFCIGIMGLLVSLLVEHWPDIIEVDIWLWFTESVVIATCLRFVLQISGQKQTSAENAAIIMVLEPVWTVLLSMLWYGETMPAQKILGCMLILFSLFLYRGWNKLEVAFLVGR
ncbi:MAG: DMT family transporter, partial [Psychromonas sp.]